MKKILALYIALFLVLASLVAYNGCSQLDKNAVTAPEIQTHAAGWIDPASPNFHGKYIKANNQWNLQACKTCHGADYKGGTTGKSCLTCHTATNGPENCTTCHGNSGSQNPLENHIFPPFSLNHDSLETDRGVGVHYHHLTDDPAERYSAQVRCVDCHQPVNNFSDASHFQNTNGKATIHFDSLALTLLPGDTAATPNPTYDAAANTCANVYCHGNFKHGNRSFQPTFNDPKSVVCGSCHGDAATGNPTPGAPNNITSPHFAFFWDPGTNTYLCYQCHSSVINQNGEIVTPEKHINGVVNVYEGMKRHK